MLRILADEGDRASIAGNLDEIVREGARRMLLSALNAEVAEYVDAHAGERDGEGKALVVRNGVGQERTVVTTAGGLQIEAPRVDDRREGHRFSSNTVHLGWGEDPNGAAREALGLWPAAVLLALDVEGGHLALDDARGGTQPSLRQQLVSDLGARGGEGNRERRTARAESSANAATCGAQ